MSSLQDLTNKHKTGMKVQNYADKFEEVSVHRII